MNYIFSFQRVSFTKCWNLTANLADFDAWCRQVDQFAIVTARPRLGTWSIITSPVEGKKCLILQTMPCTSAGQGDFCRDYCPIYANHTTRLWKPSNIKKKLRRATRKFSFGRRQIFHALHRWGDNWPRSQPRRAVTTTNWSTWRHHASKSAILAVKFQHFVKLTRWKLNV